MSISSLESKERRLLREIESLERKIERLSKSKQKSAFSNFMKGQKELAKKRSDLGDTQRKLAKERQKESAKFQKEQKKQLDELKATQQAARRMVSSGIKTFSEQSKEYDVFISYVQSDSSEYVDKLEIALKQYDIQVWRDKSNMRIGQSMTQAIENGLAKSKLAIVVISPNYLHKYWTNFELDGIFSKQGVTGEQMILPIWNNVSAEEIASKRPSLANLLAWNTNVDTVDDIVQELRELLGEFSTEGGES